MNVRALREYSARPAGSTASRSGGYEFSHISRALLTYKITNKIWLWYHIHVWKRLMCVPGKIILKGSATSVTTLTHMDNRSFFPNSISAWNDLAEDIADCGCQHFRCIYV